MIFPSMGSFLQLAKMVDGRKTGAPVETQHGERKRVLSLEESSKVKTENDRNVGKAVVNL